MNLGDRINQLFNDGEAHNKEEIISAIRQNGIYRVWGLGRILANFQLYRGLTLKEQDDTDATHRNAVMREERVLYFDRQPDGNYKANIKPILASNT
tara:strand:+ start:152 stop:439 length:288 start_codon:yes stop_codon:yes gene_type:complete